MKKLCIFFIEFIYYKIKINIYIFIINKKKIIKKKIYKFKCTIHILHIIFNYYFGHITKTVFKVSPEDSFIKVYQDENKDFHHRP